MQINIGLHSFRGLVVDYIAAPVSSNTSEHSQNNGYATVKCPCCLCPYWVTTWVYVTMVWALHLHLHIGRDKTVHSNFISESSVETHKIEVTPKM
jgi:hypothetical protein